LGKELSEQPPPRGDLAFGREQRRPSRDRAMKLLHEELIGFDAPQQASERFCVTDAEVTGVIRAEQPHIAVYTRG